ncbi:hypothetical protein [Pseudokineococcus sp. 1T1Z-3]
MLTGPRSGTDDVLWGHHAAGLRSEVVTEVRAGLAVAADESQPG